MKITREKLKQIIKEELEANMDEGIFDRIKKAFGRYTPVEPTKEAIDAMIEEMKQLVVAQIEHINDKEQPPDMKRISDVVNIVKRTPRLNTPSTRGLREIYGTESPLQAGYYYFLRATLAGYFNSEIFHNARVGTEIPRQILFLEAEPLGTMDDPDVDSLKVDLVSRLDRKSESIPLYSIKENPSNQDIFDFYEPIVRRLGVRTANVFGTAMQAMKQDGSYRRDKK